LKEGIQKNNMSAIDQAKFVIETSGKAKFIRQFINSSNDTGLSIDLSKIQFETNIGTTNYIKIFNLGPNAVYVAFDSDHEEMDLGDPLTYNFKMMKGVPFSEIAMNCEANKISLKNEVDERSDIWVIVQ
jgi:hypothetical protein